MNDALLRESRAKGARDPARSTIRVNARSAIPIARVVWWIVPGPLGPGDLKSDTLFAERVGDCDPDVVEDDFGGIVLGDAFSLSRKAA